VGGSYYSADLHKSRAADRVAKSIPVFSHDADVKSGKIAAAVAPNLSPKGVKLRESRDSDAHPVSVPIAIFLDTTGSMQQVPEIIEKSLSALMGTFLGDKASGKRYLGDGYPAVMIGAVDDYDAMRGNGEGCLQVGQFESGIEIDNDLEKLWLTGRGGETYEESYELALYFLARHTAHDHFEKRGRRGYVFLIGDEHAYPQVSAAQVQAVIGDTPQADIPLAEIVAEVKERYHLFFIIPNMTQHYDDPKLSRYWTELLGQQNVLKLEEPEKICELIASAVALCEEHVGIADLALDDVGTDATRQALIPLSKVRTMATVSAAGLPVIIGGGDAGEIERL